MRPLSRAALAAVAAALAILAALVLLGCPPLLLAALAAAALAGGQIAANGVAARARAALAAERAEREDVVRLLLRDLRDGAGDWLWETDAARLLRRVHPSLARATGGIAAEGMPLLRLLAGDAWDDGAAPAELAALIDRLNARASFRDMAVPVTLGGATRWWTLSAAPRHDARGGFLGWRGVGADITEHRSAAEAAGRAGRLDGLTGLANRAAFTTALREGLADGGRALLLIDLDRFKPVNDTLGHPVGDALLKAVAARLAALAGAGDLCARLGGDEFAMVLADAGRATVDARAAAIVAALAAPFDIDDHAIRIGGSVGSAVAPRDGRVIETLLRNADLALYRAKEDGRGVHRRFEPRLLARLERRRTVEAALREALDAGELSLLFQPIARADDGRVAGFEALLRWRHPVLGEVAPAEFVPIAAEARLLARIGDWVLRAACAQAARWPAPLRAHVNLSATQLLDPALSEAVTAALGAAGLAPHRLELEIAEDSFARDGEAIGAALHRLSGIGVRVALDGFGARHAAFGPIRGRRFATLKLDPGFVRGAAAQVPEALAIARAAVAMADTLGIAVTAAGIESEAERAAAIRLGCRHVQGFAIGMPMPADAALALVARDPPRRASRALPLPSRGAAAMCAPPPPGGV